MSAGRFVRSKYGAAYANNVHPIKVQPETLNLQIGSATNTPPTADVNNPISAVVSRNKRTRGLRPALVTLQWTGSAPANTGNVDVTTVPLLNAAMRTAASTATSETEVTYLGVGTWAIVGYAVEEAK